MPVATQTRPYRHSANVSSTSEVRTFGFVLMTTADNIIQKHLFERCAMPNFINIHPIDLTFCSRLSLQARPVFDSLHAEFLASKPTQATDLYRHVFCVVRVFCVY